RRGSRSGCGAAGGPPLALRVLAPCAPGRVTRPPGSRGGAQGAAGSRYRRPARGPAPPGLPPRTRPRPLSSGAGGELRGRLLGAGAAGGVAVRGAGVGAGVSGGGARAGDGVPAALLGRVAVVGDGGGRRARRRARARAGAAMDAGRVLGALPVVRPDRAGLPVLPVGQPPPRVRLLRILRDARRVAPAGRAAAPPPPRLPHAAP